MKRSMLLTLLFFLFVNTGKNYGVMKGQEQESFKDTSTEILENYRLAFRALYLRDSFLNVNDSLITWIETHPYQPVAIPSHEPMREALQITVIERKKAMVITQKIESGTLKVAKVPVVNIPVEIELFLKAQNYRITKTWKKKIIQNYGIDKGMLNKYLKWRRKNK